MGFGLRALNRLAGSDLLDRIRIRKQVEQRPLPGHQERLPRGDRRRPHLQGGAAAAANRRARRRASRQASSTSPPTTSSRCSRRAARAFAAEKIRPAALKADEDARDAGGAARPGERARRQHARRPRGARRRRCTSSRRSTSVLIGEALAHGDMGIAYAALAPGAVATAIGLWGTAEQEATYLPAFTGEDIPAAALAILEPRPLFDPLQLETDGEEDRRRLGPQRHQVAGRPRQRVRALRDRRRGRGPRPGPVRGRVRRQRPLGRGRAGDGPAPRRHRPPPDRRGRSSRPAPCSARASRAEDYADCVNRSRIAWCALAVGTAQAVLDYVIPYVNDRQAFGEPISNRQGVAFAVSDIGIESKACASPPTGRPAAPTTARTSPARRRWPAGSAPTRAWQIGSDGVQLLGGHGFVKEHPVERWYRDLRAAGVMEGALLV